MAKVSVIIPVLDCGRYIGESINSVLAQSYRDFEIIVVDGGSSDDTCEQVRKFGDSVRLLKSPKGIARQRNLGLEQSRGEYAAFLDADDMFLPEKLQKAVSHLEKDPSLGLVYSDAQWIDRQGNKIMLSSQEWKPLQGNIFLDMLRYCPVSTASAVICRREALRKAGFFDETFAQNEDHDLWLRVAAFYPIGYISDPLVKHRLWEGNTTRRTRDAYCYGLRLFHKLLKYQGKKEYNNIRLGRDDKAVLHFRAGQFLYYLKRFSQAAGQLGYSFYLNPFNLKTWLFAVLAAAKIEPRAYQNIRKKMARGYRFGII